MVAAWHQGRLVRGVVVATLVALTACSGSDTTTTTAASSAAPGATSTSATLVRYRASASQLEVLDANLAVLRTIAVPSGFDGEVVPGTRLVASVKADAATVVDVDRGTSTTYDLLDSAFMLGPLAVSFDSAAAATVVDLRTGGTVDVAGLMGPGPFRPLPDEVSDAIVVRSADLTRSVVVPLDDPATAWMVPDLVVAVAGETSIAADMTAGTASLYERDRPVGAAVTVPGVVHWSMTDPGRGVGMHEDGSTVAVDFATGRTTESPAVVAGGRTIAATQSGVVVASADGLQVMDPATGEPLGGTIDASDFAGIEVTTETCLVVRRSIDAGDVLEVLHVPTARSTVLSGVVEALPSAPCAVRAVDADQRASSIDGVPVDGLVESVAGTTAVVRRGADWLLLDVKTGTEVSLGDTTSDAYVVIGV